MSRILVIGKSGNVARALAATARADLVFQDRTQFDITRTGALGGWLDALAPTAVINTAASAKVDAAESDPDGAFRLNRDAPAALAAACAARDLPLLHLSSDYVFDGAKGAPYAEDDAKAPLSVYGHSKSEGEDAVLAAAPRAIVLRTSWVFGNESANFLNTMLKLAESRESIDVVADQRGRPTWARDLAEACIALVTHARDDPRVRGLYHYSGAGDASWADLAEAIFAESAKRGGPHARVKRVTSAAFGAPTRRPADSRLDCAKIAALGIRPRDWREALSACMDER